MADGIIDSIIKAITPGHGSGDETTGSGGQAKEKKIDSVVDEAAGTPSNAGTQAQSTDAWNKY